MKKSNFCKCFNIFIILKFPDLKNENEFSVVRIMNTWNKSLSVFFVTIADSRKAKNVSGIKLVNILNNLASKWDFKSSNI